MGSVSLAVRWTLGRSGRVTLPSDAEADGLLWQRALALACLLSFLSFLPFFFCFSCLRLHA